MLEIVANSRGPHVMKIGLYLPEENKESPRRVVDSGRDEVFVASFRYASKIRVPKQNVLDIIERIV